MSARSTAGVGVQGVGPWLRLIAGEPELAGPPFCVAAAIASSPSRREPGLYGRGIEDLARLVRQKPANVRRHRNTLTEHGWLPIAVRGGGRGRPTLFRLEQPSLITETGSLGTVYSADSSTFGTRFSDDLAQETSSPEAPFGADSGSPGNVYDVDTRSAGTRFLPALPLTARASHHVHVTREIDELVEQPLRLGLRAPGPELGYLREAVAEQVGEKAIAPAELLARFRVRFDQRRPDGFGGKAARALFHLTNEPLDELERFALTQSLRPVGGTPTPDRFVAEVPVDALAPAQLAERARNLRENLRAAGALS